MLPPGDIPGVTTGADVDPVAITVWSTELTTVDTGVLAVTILSTAVVAVELVVFFWVLLVPTELLRIT